jgi:hypothetical protein
MDSMNEAAQSLFGRIDTLRAVPRASNEVSEKLNRPMRVAWTDDLDSTTLLSRKQAWWPSPRLLFVFFQILMAKWLFFQPHSATQDTADGY